MLEQLSRDELHAPLPRDARASRPSATTAATAGSAPAATRRSATAASTRPASASAGRASARSAMKVAEERRFRDYRTDVTLDVRQHRGGAARACASSRAAAGPTSSTSTRPSTRPAATPARSSWCSARRAKQQRAPAAADGRRRHDGPVLRAGEPAAHRAARGARPARLPRLLLPQLRLRPRLHATRACCAPTRCRPATCCASSTSAGRW